MESLFAKLKVRNSLCGTVRRGLHLQWASLLKHFLMSIFTRLFFISNYHNLLLFRHYSEPLTPDVEGSESFTGRLMHSHDYRSNESFVNERVACLGAGPSGIDISLEIAKVAAQVSETIL